MNAVNEFEHSLITLLDYGKVKLSIVKGKDGKMHLQGESWLCPDPFYLDNFIDVDFSKNTFWDKHIIPVKQDNK